jgi:hypothetical protein
MIDLRYPVDTAKYVIFLLITGLGIGGLFQTPLIALQAAMPTRDMAVATGAMVLFRLLGAATGVAIGGSVLNNQLASRLPHIPGLTPIDLVGNTQALVNLQPPSLRDEALSAYATSISTIWIVLTPLSGVGLCCVLLAKKYTLKRKVVKEGETTEQKAPDSAGADELKAGSVGSEPPEKLPEFDIPLETNGIPQDKAEAV